MVVCLNPLPVTDIRVPGGPQAPAQIRSVLERELSDELDDARLADLRLLTTEVVANSVRHGGVDEAGWVTTSVSRAGSNLRVEVRDSGAAGEPWPRRPDFENGGGFGLFLVDQIASSWGFEKGSGLCVWFELALS